MVPLSQTNALDSHALACHRRAGRIAAQCRQWALSNIAPDVSIRWVLESIEEQIRAAGAAPGFPAQSSRNSIAAHYCSGPLDETVYQEGDCVKVDIGVHVDGYIADTAGTVDLSREGRWKPLIRASSDALAAAIATVEVGVAVGRIGAAIERTILAAGFNPVRNLTGHGLGRWKVHTAPQIPNQGENGGPSLRAGSVFAIEPFACTGRGVIRELGRAEVFMQVRSPLRSRAIDPALLADIESWHGLPVARRYFRRHDSKAVDQAIAELTRQGLLMAYPPLVEAEGVMVAQTEHSLYLGSDGVEILTA